MTAKIIKGTEIGPVIREEIKAETALLREKHGVVPGLVTIIVGKDPASVSYVTGKQKTAKELGFYSVQEDVPEDVTESALLELVDKYNKDPKIHGILVQLPLPKHINETRILYAIDPDKDGGQILSLHTLRHTADAYQERYLHRWRGSGCCREKQYCRKTDLDDARSEGKRR